MNNTSQIHYRRNVLRDIKCSDNTHAGLWLDRYLPGKGMIDNTGTEARAAHVARVAALAASGVYGDFYTRWETQLGITGALCLEAKVRGRMAVGHGAAATLETSITLHHTYGVPFIPGSALKGLAASFARQKLTGWDSQGEAYIAMFGNTASAGHMIFYDALYKPDSAPGNKPLQPDVLTPHHSDYNIGKLHAPPADWDNPIPVPFLSATGSYLIAIGGPTKWANCALDILRHALCEEGIGAKTSSGYGRMELAEMPPDPTKQRADELITRINAIRDDQLVQSINNYYQELKRLALPDHIYREVGKVLIARIDRAAKRKNLAEKPWFKELLQSLQ